MKSSDIARHLSDSLPAFQDIAVLGSGTAYHYTVHADAIENSGKFLGAPLDLNLDYTQNPNKPNVATCDPGVVFAYSEMEAAAEEGESARFVYPGSNPEIFEIRYSSAVQATHAQEVHLGAPPTILISSMEITSFKRVGPCEDI